MYSPAMWQMCHVTVLVFRHSQGTLVSLVIFLFHMPTRTWTFKDITKQIHNHSIHSQHFSSVMARTKLEPCVQFHYVTYVSQNSYEEHATWYISGGYTKNKNAGCLIQIPNRIERNQYVHKHTTSNHSTTNRRFPWLTSMMCWLTFLKVLNFERARCKHF